MAAPSPVTLAPPLCNVTSFLSSIADAMQARTVGLQAYVPGCAPRVEPVMFKARVVPSTAPSVVRMFTDAACTQAIPTETSAGKRMHIFRQAAGEKV